MIDHQMSSLGEIVDKNIFGIWIEFKPSTNGGQVPRCEISGKYNAERLETNI